MFMQALWGNGQSLTRWIQRLEQSPTILIAILHLSTAIQRIQLRLQAVQSFVGNRFGPFDAKYTDRKDVYMDFRPSRDDLWSRVERLGNRLDGIRKALSNRNLKPSIRQAWKAKAEILKRDFDLEAAKYINDIEKSEKNLTREQRLEELGRKLDHMRELRSQQPEGSSAYKTTDIIYQKLKREYQFLASQSTTNMVESMRAAWKKMF